MLEVASFLSILVASQMSSDAVVKPSTSHLQPQNKPLNTVQLQRKDGEKAKPFNGELPSLYTASRNGQLDIVRSLLDRGFDVNEMASYRNIALHGASLNGHLEVVKLLIECGSYVNSRNKCGHTPLHFASRYGHLEITRLLLDHGADVNTNTRDPDQWTPLHLASSMGHLDVALLLVERGADLDICNASGRTARQTAMAHGQLKMAELLSGHDTASGKWNVTGVTGSTSQDWQPSILAGASHPYQSGSHQVQLAFRVLLVNIPSKDKEPANED
ncbi:ankyrin repeat-containing domain protein, partial [Lactarius psammicola]